MHALRTFITLLVTCLSANGALAQSTRSAVPRRFECRLARLSDGSAAGPCLAAVDTVARITLRAPAPNSKGTMLWRGTASLGWRGGQVEPVAVEPKRGAAFRTGTQWFEVLASNVTPTALEFTIEEERAAAPTRVDLRILQRARGYLRDSVAWNQGADDQPAMRDPALGFNCPTGGGPAGARTLFCALHEASVSVDGEYWHGRPAVNAVRSAIAEAITASGAARPRHPLTDFNSQPRTRLRDVQLVFDRAIAIIDAQLRQQRI